MSNPLKYIIAVAIVAISAATAITFSQVQAQSQAITLSISPPVFELSANPGETIENQVRVDNLSESDQVVLVDVRNFTALGEEGGIDLEEEAENNSLATWVSVEETRTTIDARSSEVFNFTLDVPANAEPGGHFGSLVFKTEITPADDGTGAAVGQEVGALLLVRVAGEIVEDAEIAEFSAQNSFTSAPVTFISRISNTGNVHFRPRGTITVNNLFGREVATMQLNELNVLPDSIRRIENEWDAGRMRMGRYTANLSVAYGADNVLMNTSDSFIIFPYREVLLLLVVLTAIGFVVWKYRYNFQAAYKALFGK